MRRLLALLVLSFAPALAAQTPAIDVLAQSPADTDTDLQAICLFAPDARIPLQGALAELDAKTHGLLTTALEPSRFRALPGETLLLTPTGIGARHLLLIGLGDRRTFTRATMPDRMALVGITLLRAATMLHVQHPFFAPTIKDGGVDGFSTGDIATPVITGFLQALATERHLAILSASPAATPTQLTYLAGKQFQASTQAGIDKALATAASDPRHP